MCARWESTWRFATAHTQHTHKKATALLKASSPECNHFSDSPRVLMCRFNGSHAHAHTGGRTANVVRVFLSAVLMGSSMRMQDLESRGIGCKLGFMALHSFKVLGENGVNFGSYNAVALNELGRTSGFAGRMDYEWRRPQARIWRISSYEY